MRKARNIAPVALAAFCALVFASRVDVPFERIRFRPVVAPLQEGRSIDVPLPDLSRLSGAPSAVILRLRGAAQPAALTIAVDDVPIGNVTVPAEREIRVDLAASLPPGPGHRLTVAGDPAGWQLAYLELANVHGFSRGIVDLLILPRGRPGTTPPLWVALLVGAVLLALWPRSDWPQHRLGRPIHRTLAASVLVLFLAALLASLFTPYRILLSVDTFFLLTAVVYAEPLTRLAQRVAPASLRVGGRLAPVLPHLAVVVLVLWSVAQLHRPGVGFTSLVLFGGDFERNALPVLREVPHWVEPGSGYDGQFYAQLALDPFLQSHSIVSALDSPAYRARRILLPWTAHVIGLGDPWRVLQVFSLLNVGCWIALAWVLLRWLPLGSARTTMAWVACVLGEGLMTSMRQSLPDGPSVLLLALAAMAVEKNRRWLAAAMLGLAGLTRETNLLGVVLLVPQQFARRALVTSALQAAASAAPLFVWIWYLSTLGYAADEAGIRNFAAPLSAYVDKWGVTIRELRIGGWESYARFSLLSLIALTTQVAFFVWRRQWSNGWWRIGMVYALFLTVIGEAVWEGNPGAVGRVVLPMTVAFNVLLPGLRWPLFLPFWILGNAGVIAGLDVMKVPYFSE